jgi:hypothetical protein
MIAPEHALYSIMSFWRRTLQVRFNALCVDVTTVANPSISLFPYISLALSACLLNSSAGEASPELHSELKHCPERQITSAFLVVCLTMLCTSATFSLTKFSRHSPPDVLCASQPLLPAFLPQLSLNPLTHTCFFLLSVLAHLLP